MARLKRIAVEQLLPGMYIKEFCGSWMEHPFWRSSFLLDSPDDLKRILASSIKEVWIDPGQGLDVEMSPDVVLEEESEAEVDALLEQASHSARTLEAVPLQDELAHAVRIFSHGKEAITSMFNEVRMGKVVDTVLARRMVDEIADSVTRNASALISLARLKNADDYTYMHSVAVCALMVALARQLGLSDEQTRAAGMAGLMHDLGKALMPLEVLNKPGKLSEAEFAIIKGHPVEGHRLLLSAENIDAITLDVCLHHHEKVDGSGYPEGLKADAISLFAKMGAVCDVYDAITSNRPYKAGWDPAESIRKMAEWAEGHFDGHIFQAFVKSLGIYPTGSLVRMQSGRLGVVVEQSKSSLLTPRVKLFYSINAGCRIAPKLIDLSQPGCQDKIAAREAPEKWNFPDLNELWAS